MRVHIVLREEVVCELEAFAARGRTLTRADCLVAAAARALGGRLATSNPTDFPMGEVAVEHWPVGASSS